MPQLTEIHIAILSYFADGNKKRKDKIFKEFESSRVTKENVETVLSDLENCGYIKQTDITRQAIMINHVRELAESDPGYAITYSGKARLQRELGNQSTVYSNINNANIAHQSTNVRQSIKISEQPSDIQEKIAELQNAIAKKDSSAIKKAFGYIADKSVDVAIAIMAGAIAL